MQRHLDPSEIDEMTEGSSFSIAKANELHKEIILFSYIINVVNSWKKPLIKASACGTLELLCEI